MHANLLLDHLPAGELRRLLPIGSSVQLRIGQDVALQNQRCRCIHFPLQGWICLVTRLEPHAPLQLGMVGAEGAIGAHLLLGQERCLVGAVVQEGGEAWRLPAHALRRALAETPGLQRLLGRYLMVQMRTTITMAACLHFHTLRARLARCLLMVLDRAGGRDFAATHELLARLLGVRRVGVTVAAGSLQDAGLIQYQRGRVDVLDRRGLQAASCSCYEQDRQAYQRGMRFAPAARSHPMPGPARLLT
ncbi:Crp/Fnr family transcriptional regulator [Pelomonas sp. APW6]|uniref:Crp/Fnr family transcriptional regulator n=1 Tax=Roseateles subflavus TaxID=3053353 RepID=A0ABT7LGD7_9BURK|nr:Crp/Fnr family transcriptional regulator [Pelomonas sp. APW6]MDL5031255.1 Crp/Fnr family transcriptional regulator [Pelomonas sp. APW6]